MCIHIAQSFYTYVLDQKCYQKPLTLHLLFLIAFYCSIGEINKVVFLLPIKKTSTKGKENEFNCSCEIWSQCEPAMPKMTFCQQWMSLVMFNYLKLKNSMVLFKCHCLVCLSNENYSVSVEMLLTVWMQRYKND